MANPAWVESDLIPQPSVMKPKSARTSQSVAQLTEICQAQADDLAAKDVVITYLKKKVKCLEETLAKTTPSSCDADPATNTALQTQASSRKRPAAEQELQTPQRKVARLVVTHVASFLKAASDEMKSCIKWGGDLHVQFELCAEPGVFLKVFDGCKRAATSSSQEPGELPEPGDTKTVQLDRDDMYKAGRKFRYTGQGTIESLTVTYDKTSKVVCGKGTWAFSQTAA